MKAGAFGVPVELVVAVAEADRGWSLGAAGTETAPGELAYPE
jgi:hypothetical protein